MNGRFTWLGRRIILYYAAMFLLAATVVNWTSYGIWYQQLLLEPLWSGQFAPWQFVTHLALYYPLDLLSAALNGLVFWWIAYQVEGAIGSRKFLGLVFGVPFVAGLLAFPFTHFGLFGAPFAGFSLVGPVLVLAWILQNERGQMALFFVLPLRGYQLIWAIIGIEVLTFFPLRQNPNVLYQLIALGLTWLYLRSGGVQSLIGRFQLWRLRRRYGRFVVHEGGRVEREQGPTYH